MGQRFLAAWWGPRGVEGAALYTRKARAWDVWSIGCCLRFAVASPRKNAEQCRLSQQQRCAAPQHDMPVLVDPVKESLERSFAPWPFCLYLPDSCAACVGSRNPQFTPFIAQRSCKA